MDTTPTEQELRTFAGRNADYYMTTWRPSLEGDGTFTRLNLAGFFLGGLWLGYRKMYSPLLILYALIFVESIAEIVIFVGVLRMDDSPRLLSGLVGLTAGVIVGVYGNRWYLARARRVIAEVRSLGLSEGDHMRELTHRGGTNLWGCVGLFIVFLAGMATVTVILFELFDPQ